MNFAKSWVPYSGMERRQKKTKSMIRARGYNHPHTWRRADSAACDDSEVAVTWPTWGAEGQWKIIVDGSDNKETWKAVKGWWQFQKQRYMWMRRTAMAAEVMGVCVLKESLSAQNINRCIDTFSKISNVVCSRNWCVRGWKGEEWKSLRKRAVFRTSMLRAFGIRTNVICDLCLQYFPKKIIQAAPSLCFPWRCKIARTSGKGNICRT